MVAAEAAPYSTVGGLSQVVYFLSTSLLNRGNDVRIFTPKYGIIKPKNPFTEITHHLQVPTGYTGNQQPENLICNVVQSTSGSPLTYFLENQEYYELRSNVYEYADDHIRFFLLSRGCLEFLKIQKEHRRWFPDLIHIHDWHTSYLSEDIRRGSYRELFHDTPLLLTVHNFHMQGKINFQFLPIEERDDGKAPLKHFFDKDLPKQNPLLRGIMYADWVNTVSETHAHEVLTGEYGEGLDHILKQYRGKLSGILNGLDFKEFSPRTDPLLKFNYNTPNPKTRALNKQELQKEFRLPQRPHIPVIAYSGRLSKQKGIDLILDILPHFLEEHDIQWIILGSGDNYFRKEVQKLAERFPKKLACHLYTNFKLPRKIFAGADMILLPSIFEPGGIVAIEALRYGAIPIVRKTGGLADIVSDFTTESTGNGFVFEQPSPWALFAAIIRALTTYHYPSIWVKAVQNAMAGDFSWSKVAQEYERLYRRVIRQRNQFLKENPHPARSPA